MKRPEVFDRKILNTFLNKEGIYFKKAIGVESSGSITLRAVIVFNPYVNMHQ